MWIMTTIGFFSIVRKHDGTHVRARCKKDIDALVKLCHFQSGVIHIRRADYQWRIIINGGELDYMLHKFNQLVTYDNFKAEVKKTNSRREKLYHQVWATLLSIEKEKG